MAEDPGAVWLRKAVGYTLMFAAIPAGPAGTIITISALTGQPRSTVATNLLTYEWTLQYYPGQLVGFVLAMGIFFAGSAVAGSS